VLSVFSVAKTLETLTLSLEYSKTQPDFVSRRLNCPVVELGALSLVRTTKGLSRTSAEEFCPMTYLIIRALHHIFIETIVISAYLI
jgi:hypothetical protein